MLVCSISAYGQQITVTGTVHDSNGAIYVGGSGSAVLVPQNVMWTVNTFNPVPSPVPIAQLDSFGRFSITLTNTAVIDQQSLNPQWQFSFCSAQYTNPTAKYCFTMTPLALTSSQDITATITPQAAILPTQGGGGTPCVTTNFTVQFNLNSVFGCTNATYNNGTGVFTFPGSTILSGGVSGNTNFQNNLSVTGLSQFLGGSCDTGPRPWIDVTCPPYGAKGDSQTDDTAAINAAMTAACATTTLFNGFPMHPAVVFPPGIYRVAQPQGSSAPIFTIPCTFLEVRGLPGGSASQFANPTSSIVVTPGASPGSGPLFLVQGPTAHNIRFADIAVTGYNEAYWLRSTADITFDNAPMAITGQTGLTDNAALKITNTEEVWRVNRSNASAVHANGSEDPTTPTVLYTNETPLGAEAALNGYIHTSDVVDTGGGEQCIQRVNAGGELIQHFTFKNTFLEDSNTGFLTCTNTSGVPMSIAAMEFESVGVEPFTVTTAVLTLNDSQGQMSGIIMNDVAEGSLAIQVLAGHLYGYSVNGCNTLCSNQVVDANGNSIGTGQTYERYGAIDHFSDNSFLVAQPTAGLANQFSASPTISDRWCPSGRMFCSLGADPSFGFLFGSGDSNGFNVGLNQTAIETLDVQFASLLPPTAFSGTATTGGTLAAGTYFAQIWSASNLNCTNAPISAPTYSTGVVVGGSNNAINFAWTVPITTPSAPAGYCLEIQNSAISPGSEIFAYLFASGAGTTTFSYTGQAQNGTGVAPANAMVSLHRFTQNALGINTTSPSYDLDVAHSSAANTGVRAAGFVDTALTPGTSPICPNGASGAFTTVGCAGGGGGSSIFTSYQFGSQTAITGANNYLQTTYPSIFTTTQTGSGTSGSPFVDAIGLSTQNANSVWAGPTSGGAATPSFRALVSADIPNNAANTTGNAATATTWANSRLLAGNSVNGSANVPFANLFIVGGTSDSGLSNAQFLGALSTGILKNTTTTGLLSIAGEPDITGLWTGSCSSSTFLRGDGACAAPSGSGTVNSGTQFAFAEYATSTNAVGSGPTPPSVQGQYLCGYFVPSSSAVAPTCPQAGMTPRAVTGTTSTDTILFGDNLEDVDYQGSVAVAVSLPTPTSLNNPTFVTRLINNTSGSATAVTVTATTLTFQSTGSTTLAIPQGQQCLLKVDPSTTVWDDTCNDLALVAGTNITITRGQYGPTISATGSGSGTVGSCATSNALGIYGTATSTTVGCGNGDYTYATHTLAGGASSIFDMSAATSLNAFRVPSQASETSNGVSSIAYDTTHNNFHVPANGADAINLAIPTAPTTGDVADYVVASSVVLAHDSGVLTANLVTQTSNASSGQICTYTGTNKVCVPATAIPNGVTATTQSQNDNSTKVATTAYTDLAVANGMAAVNPAAAVLAASTANLTGTYVQVGGGIGDTFTVTATGAFSLDGIAINTIGQRVLLKNQTTASQNGVYTATVVGTTGVSPVFTRALDYDTPSDVNNSGIIPVQSGTANIGTTWLLTSQVTSIGSSGSSLTYAQYSVNSANVVQAVSPGAGVAHFAGSTQTVTSSAVTPGDATGNTTGSGNFVLVTSPTLVTPALGAATATSLLASGIVDGKAPVTVTTGTTATLGAATYQSGYTFNQEATAGTGVTYTLPATATGLQYCVANSIVSGTGAPNTGVLTVYPPASSYIIYKGVRNTIGGGGTHGIASGGAAADAACFVAVDATDWVVYAQSGTWTEN